MDLRISKTRLVGLWRISKNEENIVPFLNEQVPIFIGNVTLKSGILRILPRHFLWILTKSEFQQIKISDGKPRLGNTAPRLTFFLTPRNNPVLPDSRHLKLENIWASKTFDLAVLTGPPLTRPGSLIARSVSNGVVGSRFRLFHFQGLTPQGVPLASSEVLTVVRLDCFLAQEPA